MKRRLNQDSDEDSRNKSFRLEEDDDALPLACSICTKPFLNPIVTNCHHYFCHRCALMHHAKNITCFVCNQPTLGIFNTAEEIKKKIEKQRNKASVMLKKVSQMLEIALAKANYAKTIATEAEEMVNEVETMVEKVSGKIDYAKTMEAEAGSMVNEVETMVEKVSGRIDYGKSLAGEAEEMVKEVETMVEKAAVKAEMAETLAVNVVKILEEADANMETARRQMYEAFLVIKTIKWNI